MYKGQLDIWQAMHRYGVAKTQRPDEGTRQIWVVSVLLALTLPGVVIFLHSDDTWSVRIIWMLPFLIRISLHQTFVANARHGVHAAIPPDTKEWPWRSAAREHHHRHASAVPGLERAPQAVVGWSLKGNLAEAR